MNKLSIITAFLGGVKNRYMQYNKNRSLLEKFEIARQVKQLDGLELCYPADFEDVGLLKQLLADAGLGVSAINVRSRRQDKWIRGSFTSEIASERQEVVDEFKQAMDVAHEVGTDRLSS